MATATREKLSGSTDGRGIKVTGTATGASVTIHTASATTTAGLGDNIDLWAYNDDTVTLDLTIEWGGTSVPDDIFTTPIPPKAGLVPICTGKFLRNSLVVKAWAGNSAGAGTANKIVVHGEVTKVA